MKSLLSIFLASPVFAHSALSALMLFLYFTLIPAFALLALHGVHLVLGISQVIVICVAEAVQWRFTRRAQLPAQLTGAIATYLLTNLVFSLLVFFVFSSRK